MIFVRFRNMSTIMAVSVVTKPREQRCFIILRRGQFINCPRLEGKDKMSLFCKTSFTLISCVIIATVAFTVTLLVIFICITFLASISCFFLITFVDNFLQYIIIFILLIIIIIIINNNNNNSFIYPQQYLKHLCKWGRAND